MEMHARSEDHPRHPDRFAATSGFEAFFREHYRSVVRLAYNVVGDFQTSQDVAQEVFVAAHRRFPYGQEQAAGWVRVAAVHTALNMVRGENRRDSRQRLARGVDSVPSAEEAVIDHEARDEVRRALARLSRRSAAVLVMRYGGMSYLEIADALGIKVGNIGTLLRRAESALCKEMDHVARN
jgi:RNA polymerase sigma-70 factor (ECF subfamily)